MHPLNQEPSTPRVAVVLAVFNGERFLAEQLSSITAQTYPGWELLIRDDGSTDATLSIIKDHQERHPERIHVLLDNDGNLGPSANFGVLASSARADYVMFCDQDDVWLPDKIERTLEVMRTMESDHGSETPILVHTDALVVTETLSPLAESLWHSQHLNVQKGQQLNRLLNQNIVTGCTVMINKALRDMAVPVPRKAMMHDWWFALVAVSLGRIGRLHTPTVLYRQHSGNRLGAGMVGMRDLLGRIGRGDAVRAQLRRQQLQAEVFLHRFHTVLSPAQRRLLSDYSRLHSCGFFQKRYLRIRHGFWYGGFFRNLCRLALG